MNIIEMNDVCRSFGNDIEATFAVNHLNLAVPQGSVYGLLGANGAGKTTSIRMLISHLKPDSGDIRVLGENPATFTEKTRKQIAYISENMQIPHWMSIEDAVGFCKPLYPKWDDGLLQKLLNLFNLKMSKRYEESSKGQRRAICIILAMCQNPDVLIMDEPASGLDTLSRRHFLSEILNIACNENKTVLFSSHILGDIERTVDRVAILSQGSRIIEGELDSLKETIKRISLRGEAIGELPQQLFQTLRIVKEEDSIQWVVTDYTEEKMNRLYQLLPENISVETEGFNLEELFLIVNSDRDNKEISDNN
ncbi:MAG: ABC transporter ATP-binding protein [Planctomycetaceae bacterium]|jgi:ABC-2 type transport system ATP-binding protein|nr:ABC transporter ATP-binding protein [Planctomycetaceae bacterium]